MAAHTLLLRSSSEAQRWRPELYTERKGYAAAVDVACEYDGRKLMKIVMLESWDVGIFKESFQILNMVKISCVEIALVNQRVDVY